MSNEDKIIWVLILAIPFFGFLSFGLGRSLGKLEMQNLYTSALNVFFGDLHSLIGCEPSERGGKFTWECENKDSLHYRRVRRGGPILPRIIFEYLPEQRVEATRWTPPLKFYWSKEQAQESLANAICQYGKAHLRV